MVAHAGLFGALRSSLRPRPAHAAFELLRYRDKMAASKPTLRMAQREDPFIT